MVILFFILIVALILYVQTYGKNQQKEGFGWDAVWLGKVSPDCYSEPLDKCLDHSNCGMCLDKNKGNSCLPGNQHGPFFREDCQKWKYTNRYDRRIFNGEVTRETPTWNVRLPDYEIWYPSPVSRSALR